MKFIVIEDTPQLLAFKRFWQAMDLSAPLHDFELMVQWCRSFENDDREFRLVVGCDEAGNWQGVAPFLIDVGLGRKLSLAHPCGEFGLGNTIITRPDAHQAFVDGLVNWITQCPECTKCLGYLDAVDLGSVDNSDPTVEYLLDQFVGASFRAHVRTPFRRLELPLPGQYSTFEENMAPSTAEQCGDWMGFVDETIDVRSSRENEKTRLWQDFIGMRVALEPALDDLFADDRRIHFFRNALFHLIDHEVAEIKVLYLGASPISGVILLESGHRVIVCETAISSFVNLDGVFEWTILETIRSAIGQGVSFLEMKESSSDYLELWHARPISLSTVRLIPPRFSARLKHSIVASSEAILGSLHGVR